MTIAPPEPGQLVEVRRRQWIVADVIGSSIGDGKSVQHLVELSSLDEDALDETLTAIWEIEPGARVVESAGLPRVDGWDTCERLEAFLDAIRWGATTHADRSLLQAPFRSGVQIEDYQLDPLVRAIDLTRANLLIADDVGLGKTIEAGLIIQEFIIRHRARTVLIVCPASLQMKWKTEMHEKFGLEFRIVNTDFIKRLRRERGIHANPWTSFPRLIASMDWMKSGEGLRLIKDVLPLRASYPRKFDILVVDEAHNIAPSGASYYSLPSKRTRLIETLAPHFEHKLFLSATPHNGYDQSFTMMLELLDNQRFVRGRLPENNRHFEVMIRRLKTDLVNENGEPLYSERDLKPLNIAYTDEEKEIHALLKDYTESRTQSMEGKGSKFGLDFIHLLLKKRLFSSPRAFATTLAKHRETISKKGSRPSKSLMKERILLKSIQKCSDEYASDSQLERNLEDAVRSASEMCMELTDEQSKMLQKLGLWADTAKNRRDSKADAILAWLDRYLKTDGEFNGKRVIMFTEYRATHSWLMEVLASEEWQGERLLSLHGGTDQEEREKIIAAFQASPDISKVQILLATDAAAEGIDLQNHCNYMIHIEVPWNPNKMEQRNGRIDRHGQKNQVHIWHPVGRTTMEETDTGRVVPGDIAGDHQFLLAAARKVNKIREDLGSVGPVIAEQIEEAMLGKREVLDTRTAESLASRARPLVASERKLKERIARLHQRLLDTRADLELSPDRIYRAVKVALEILEKPPLTPKEIDGVASGTIYEVPLLTGFWDQATHGLPHPFTGERRPITFEHKVAEGRDDIVLAHLHHKLVQLSLRLLRAEVWAHKDLKKLNRVAFRKVAAGTIENPAVIVWSRLVVTGGGHHRLHEELTRSGGELKQGSFARIRTLSQLDQLFEASIPVEPTPKLFSRIQSRFENQKDSILAAVETRSQERLNILSNTLERRKKKDLDDLNKILDDLEQLIEEELSWEPVQLKLWPEAERNQRSTDEAALTARLQRIPEEREEEMRAIRSRYVDIAGRTFPVAIEFLIPDEFLERS